MSEEESLPGLESSDSSEEPDDEFMLRLYTGKLKNDQQYHLRKEGTDTAGTDEVRFFLHNMLKLLTERGQ